MKKIRDSISKHKKLTIAAVVLLLVIIAAGSCGGSDTNMYEEETVSARDIYTYRSFVGNVEPSADTSVISQVSQQVVELNVEKGDEVHEGDVIAVIDSSSVEDSIELKEASLNSAKTSNSYNIGDAQRNYDNYKETIDSDLNSSLNSAEASLRSAYEAVKSAIEDYDETEAALNDGTYSGTKDLYNAMTSAKAAYDTAKSDVTKAEEAVESAKKSVTTAEAAAAEAQTALTEAEKALNNADVTPENYAELQNHAEKAKSELEKANAGLEEAKTGLAEAEKKLSAAKTAEAAAKSAYDQAKEAFEETKEKILEEKAAVKDQAWETYDNAEKSYASTELSVNQQLETYEAALEKTKGTAAAGTKGSEIELENLKESLNDYTITAPCDGTITELSIEEGGMVTSGVPIATISNLNNMKVSINVDEYSILDTAVGSDVTVIVDSIQKTYEGTLSYVADVATLTNGVAYFEATVDFVADEYVKSGMSVEVRLTSADQKGVTAVSVDAVYYNDDNTAYVIVKNDDSQEVRPVETGVSDGNYVEILSGLAEGDIVLKEPTGFVMPKPVN